MRTPPGRLTEEPYLGKPVVRFCKGLGRRLPSLLDKFIYIYDILFFALLFTINALIILGYHGVKDIWNQKKSLPGLVANFFFGVTKIQKFMYDS